ncbi:condensation domain-containing protein [Allorhizocola rhizosphaerae]|uniref:condensation domain-containing protein n=1 Tax=Allorhizocola rhizosphaerae TaxID=1872709 RepID=UPI0013C30DAD|nr:condensation domain-containing protein [Allorhizocola rhizosphaerae]
MAESDDRRRLASAPSGDWDTPTPVASSSARQAELWAEFRGQASSPEPLTWGQRSIWKAYSEFRPHTAWLNISRVVAVPRSAGEDAGAVVRAIGALMSRHESLRTRIEQDETGLRQVPAPGGRLQVHLVESDDAESIKDSMGAVPFDYLGEWPLRATLVMSGGRVTHVALVFSHVAVDFHASEILMRELRLLLLRGQITTPAGLQSVDVARQELGPMKHRSDRARDHWLGNYEHLPHSMFDPVAPPLTPRFRRALLVSPAADIAMRALAARHGVSTATVLLAMTSVLICRWTGHDRCALFLMVNNRYQPGYRDAISKLNQLGLFVLEVGDDTDTGSLMARAWRAASRAYRHAYYDPYTMDEAIRQTGRPTGSAFEPWCYVNDLRLPGLTDTVQPPSDSSPAALEAALQHTSLSWPETLDRFAWRFRLQVMDAPTGLGLSITADTHYLPPERIERFLRELERLIVNAAVRLETSGDDQV